MSVYRENPAARRPRRDNTWSAIALRIVRILAIGIIVVALSLLFALPLIWMVSSSLKTDRQIFALPPVWIPNPIVWSNYPRALEFIDFGRYVRNTLTISGANIVGAVLSCTLAGYGFSRLRWPGRDQLFMVVIATMMLPGAVTMVPMFIIFRQLGWVGTYLPLTVPSFFGGAFFIFLLRQFFLTIPQELSDAARMDGANEFGIMTRVILPLARPALAMVVIFQFIWSWGDYLGPLIYINRQENYTVAIGLTLFNSQHSQEWALLMAASTVSLLPVLLLFFFTQRTFIEGISMTGLKG